MATSLLPLHRHSCDRVLRHIAAHWRWCAKALLASLPPHHPLLALLAEYSSTVRRHPAISSRSYSKLRRAVGSAPPPPTSPEHCRALALITRADAMPLLRQPLHLARLHCWGGERITATLQSLATGATLAEVAEGVAKVQEEYLALVEEGGEVQVHVEAFLGLQTAAVMEEMVVKGGATPSPHLALLGVHHRALLLRGEHALLPALALLHARDRPALRLVAALEHDPVRRRLVARHGATGGGLLPLLATLVARDGAAPVSCLQEKIEQLSTLLQHVKAADCTVKKVTIEEVHGEVEELLRTLETCLKLATTDPELAARLHLLAGTEELQEVAQVLKLLAEEVAREGEASILTVEKASVFLQCARLQLHSRFGALDPAEKQALKHRYAGEAAEGVRRRLEARATFAEHLGGATHPHNALLRARLAALEKEQERRAGLRAVRGEEADFPGLSSAVRHFAASLGSPANLAALLGGLEAALEEGEAGSALVEVEVWCKSATSFLRSLLTHSSFPDLTSPVAEAVAGLVEVMGAAAAGVGAALAREEWPGLDTAVVAVAAGEPRLDLTLQETAAWLLGDQVIHIS